MKIIQRPDTIRFRFTMRDFNICRQPIVFLLQRKKNWAIIVCLFNRNRNELVSIFASSPSDFIICLFARYYFHCVEYTCQCIAISSKNKISEHHHHRERLRKKIKSNGQTIIYKFVNISVVKNLILSYHSSSNGKKFKKKIVYIT